MTEPRSFPIPSSAPEAGQLAHPDGWGRRLASRTAWIAAGGLLAIGVAGYAIDSNQNASFWPLLLAVAAQAIGLVGCWAAEGWQRWRDGRRAVGTALVLLGPVVATVAGGLSWIVTIWAAYAMW